MFRFVGLFLFLLLGLSLPVGAATLLQEADQAFGDHNYKEALTLYDKAQKDPRFVSDSLRVRMRVLQSLDKLQDYDRFIPQLEIALKQVPDLLWRARYSALGAQVYRRMPHQGYLRNGTLYRNTDRREGVYTWVWDQDHKQAEIYYTAARKNYFDYLYTRKARLKDIEKEVLNLVEELGFFYRDQSWLPSARKDWPILVAPRAPGETLKAEATPFQKAYFLYYESLKVAQNLKDNPAQVRLQFAWNVFILRRLGLQAADYPDLDPLLVFQALLKTYPQDALADKIQLSLGDLLNGRQQYAAAIENWEMLLKRHPQSLLVNVAHDRLQNIRWPSLHLQVPGVQTPDQPARFQVGGRNLKDLTFKLCAVDLQRELTAFLSLNNPNLRFVDFNGHFGASLAENRSHCQAEVLSWNWQTEAADYTPFQRELTLSKALPAGAYLLQAEGQDVEASALVILSDLSLVQKQAGEQTLFYLSSAHTGKPMANATLYIKETTGSGLGAQVKHSRIKTGADGLYLHKRQLQQPGTYLDAYAVLGAHHAVNQLRYWYYADASPYYKVYAYTDRPIYRPGQKVSFRQVLRLAKEGQYQTPAGQKVELRLLSPRGEELFKQTLTSDRWGAIHGAYALPTSATLGMYQFQLNLPEHPGSQLRLSGGQQFRVEEYRKPEFLVKVTPPSAALRPGESAKVTISADYYAGGRVQNGSLKYTLKRQYFYPAFQARSNPWDWFYGAWDNSFDDYHDDDAAILKQETVSLNAEGQAEISVPTEASPSQDWEYVVEAEVTDHSRRVQNGRGVFRVTRQSWYASLDFDRGLYSPGERIETEINLVDPNGQPVPKQAGLLTIEALEGKDTVKKLKAENLSSDALGRIFYRWQPPSEGRYRFVFSGRDAFERPVSQSREVWVAGPQFEGRRFHFEKVDILSDKRIYQAGETARLMVTVKDPDSYVLLLEEAENMLIGHHLLAIAGHSKVVQLKLSPAHTPNFNLRAITVRHQQMLQDSLELFVPPEERFLKVAFKSKKSEFRPGEKAEVEVEVKDSRNRPVQTGLSLALTDASVYQLQADRSGDIRNWFFQERRSFSDNLQGSLQVGFSPWAKVLKERKHYPLPPQNSDDGLNDGDFYGRREGFAGGEMLMDAVARPAPQPAAEAAPSESKSKKDNENAREQDRQQAPTQATPRLRQNFPDTAFWNPELVTDQHGKAKVTLAFPDSLTTWKLIAKGVSAGAEAGEASTELQTTQKLQMHMLTPRFLTEGDEVVLSGRIRNAFAQALTVKAQLLLPTDLLQALQPTEVSVSVPAQGEKRVDWRVKVKQAGLAQIRMTALSKEESDAVEMPLPLQIYGAQKQVTLTGSFKTEHLLKTVMLPTERKPEATRLTLTLNASLAGTLLEALPYLAEFPYGCIEQTTSRFVPALLTARTLKKLGLKLEDLSAQKNLDVASLNLRKRNPVYDPQALEKMVAEGIIRITSMQNPDGGWGWWSGFSSDLQMSTYVYDALSLAREADYPLDAGLMNRAESYLLQQFKTGQALNQQAYLAFVLSAGKKIQPGELESLFKRRDQLSHSGKALLAQAYQRLGQADRARLILQNLKSFVKVDADEDVASWKTPDQGWWYWYQDRVETQALILRAFVAISPQDPVVPQLVRWLVYNRQSNRWNSTRDTAQVIYALSGWMAQNKELESQYTLAVKLNGRLLKTIEVTPANSLSFDNRIELADNALQTGENTLTIEKSGSGTLYYSLALDYFSREAKISASGNRLQAERSYYRVSKTLNPGSQKMEEQFTPIMPGEALTSGEEVEARLSLKAPNDYEYVMLEDFKPAGLEALSAQSGYNWQNGVGVYREFRDNRVAFFLSQLPEGTQVLSYRLRAETPGLFSALPMVGEAMYAPAVRAISDSFQIGVRD
ncbi:MAG: alpha-2-macroglobulin [Candidatus Sericytochromatia bacterium]